MKVKPTPPPDNVAKALGFLVSRDAGSAAAAPPRFRITSEVLDRHDDRVKLAGLDVANYLKNPVVLWNHDDSQPAIGTARVFEEGGEWFMEPAFDEVCALSKTVAAKVAAGTLRTCSIRFRVLAHSFNEEGGLDFEQVELLEVSITNIPANPEAIRVKNQIQKTKSTDTTATEETPAKALEQADLDAIQAAISAALAPVLERLDALAAALPKSEASAEEVKDEASEEAPLEEEEAKDEDGMEMSDEEAAELKDFFSAALRPKPKAK